MSSGGANNGTKRVNNANNNNASNNANVHGVLKNVQNAQSMAKGNRDKIKRASTPRTEALSAIEGEKRGGILGMMDSAKSWLSSSGEVMTRFNRNRTGSSTPSGSPYGRSGIGSPSGLGGPGGPGGLGGPRGSRGDGDEDSSDGRKGTLKRLFGIDEITRVLYVLKFLRLFVVFGALYLASKTFQTRYVSAVFVNNEPPPSLVGFILTFVVIELIFMSLIMFIVMLLAKTLDMNEMFPITDEVFALFLFDSIVSSVLTAILGLMLAMVVMKKKYFRYRTDGMRAIRSLQEMLRNVAIVTSLLPYYIIERA